ncbi:MAG: cysteine-rich CWC family protein [Rubrivivax sp.]
MSTPPAAFNARCERCGGGFHCGVRDAGPCACGGLDLSPALLARLRRDYRACLCLDCLQALAQADEDAAERRTPDAGALFRAS